MQIKLCKYILLVIAHFGLFSFASTTTTTTGGEDKVAQAIQAATKAYHERQSLHLLKGAQSARGPNKSTPLTDKIGKTYKIFRDAFTELTQKHSMNREEALKRLRDALPQECNHDDDEIQCDSEYKYRTVDGTCNNLKNPRWGATRQPFVRLLSPAYVGDNDDPRGTGTDLQNPRNLSTVLHSGDGKKFESNVTHMVAQFGQFLDHDITLTPVENFKCCDNADVSENCWKIDVPTGDAFYTEKNVTCLDFVRSTPACFPQSGTEQHREQFNDLTAFIDASVVYGSDNNTFHLLRSHEGGLLVENSEHDSFLPWNSDVIENGSKDTVIAGDRRANEMPGLTTMHVLFLREHNRIAKALSSLRKDWDDERLFQETRRIVGASLQSITYSEFLPAILGDRAMKDYDLQLPLEPTSYTSYNSSENPTIFNSFSTAAYRFGHTLVNGLIELFMGERIVGDYHVKDNYLISDQLLKKVDDGSGSTGYDQILNGLFRQRSQAFDREIHEDMTNYLFMDKATKIGEDLAARNIQRGRDHGIPSYNEFRKYCKLDPLTSWNEMPSDIDAETWDKLKEVYNSPDEIDLYTGGLSETAVATGLSGPTFVCLQGDQFKRLKDGDRFFFTHKEAGFTEEQLATLRQRTLANIICENSAIKETPRNIFYVTSQLNPMLPCDAKRALDISVFANEDVDDDATTSTTPSAATTTTTKIASLSLYFLYTGICFALVFTTSLKLSF